VYVFPSLLGIGTNNYPKTKEDVKEDRGREMGFIFRPMLKKRSKNGIIRLFNAGLY